MEQMTLAEALTQEAIARVGEAADEAWMAQARRTLSEIAARLPLFTTDDLWAAGLPSPREPRALGAVMREVARAGICAATDQYRRSTRPECHTRPVRVWRSLIV